jgi:broad specificity phosphatase PhoE
MTRLLLVRHARPVADFGTELDPGLDDTGRRQAEEVARRLGAGPSVPVVSSPLRRARETAAPLARRWASPLVVDDAFGEIPAPAGDPATRAAWLRQQLASSWGEVEPRLLEWRRRLLDALRALPGDTVVVTHFVAINTAVGAATGDDRLVSCAPGHASVTELEVADGGIVLARS